MSNMPLRPSAILAWNIANRFAQNTGSCQIEPAHIFLAILVLMDSVDFYDAQSFQLSESDLAGVRADIEQCRELLTIAKEDGTRLRKKLYTELPASQDPRAEAGALPRSEGTLLVFRSAVTRARQHDQQALTMADLLGMLLLAYQTGTFQDPGIWPESTPKPTRSRGGMKRSCANREHYWRKKGHGCSSSNGMG
jgi:hypothetical protein